MTSRSLTLLVPLAAIPLLVVGCGDDDDDGGGVDSGVVMDAGPVEEDAGPVEEDAGPVEEDAGPVEEDAGPVEEDAGPGADVEVVDCAAVTPAQTINAELPDFSPDDVTVSTGDVVQWTNTGAVAHTTTSGTGGPSPAPDGMWDEDLAVGESACVRFNVAGSYPYFCDLHPVMMRGEITVE